MLWVGTNLKLMPTIPSNWEPPHQAYIDPGLTSPSSRFLLEVIEDLSVIYPPEYAPNNTHPSSPADVKEGHLVDNMAQYEGANDQWTRYLLVGYTYTRNGKCLLNHVVPFGAEYVWSWCASSELFHVSRLDSASSASSISSRLSQSSSSLFC